MNDILVIHLNLPSLPDLQTLVSKACPNRVLYMLDSLLRCMHRFPIAMYPPAYLRNSLVNDRNNTSAETKLPMICLVL